MTLHLEDITFRVSGYPHAHEYPFNLEILRGTPSITLSTAVTLFVGENGSGKSTVLQAVARKCGIHIWRFESGRRYVNNPYEERLCDYIDVRLNDGVPGTFFGSDIFRDFALLLDEWASADPGVLEYFGGKSLMTQSHGQSIMAFMRHRFALRGIYFLDEPETALSPRRQLELRDMLTEYGERGNAQFIIATHSPILMSCAGSAIFSFDCVPIRRVRFSDTEHYRIYRRFFSTAPDL